MNQSLTELADDSRRATRQDEECPYTVRAREGAMSLALLVTGRFRRRGTGEPYVADTAGKPKNWLSRLLAAIVEWR